jgi:hypothetical protein
MAVIQSTLILNVPASSLASQLPQGICGEFEVYLRAQKSPRQPQG